MNNQKINTTGLKLLDNKEGCRLKAYWDSTGKCWTIGWGHTGKDVYQGLEITQQEADVLQLKDLQNIEKQLNLLNLNLTDNQFSALEINIYEHGFSWFLNSLLYQAIKTNSTKVINYSDVHNIVTHKGTNIGEGFIEFLQKINYKFDEIPEIKLYWLMGSTSGGVYEVGIFNRRNDEYNLYIS